MCRTHLRCCFRRGHQQDQQRAKSSCVRPSLPCPALTHSPATEHAHGNATSPASGGPGDGRASGTLTWRPSLAHPNAVKLIREALTDHFGEDKPWHFAHTYRTAQTLFAQRSKILRRHDMEAVTLEKHAFMLDWHTVSAECCED